MNKSVSNFVSCVPLTLAVFLSPLGTAQNTTTSIYSGVLPHSAPKYWLETFDHDDLSRSQLLVFQTIPGVNYRVEKSNDLIDWSTVGSHSGGGQQVVVPMVQIEAAAVPESPPEDPPPPIPHIWLMMQKATEGGIVLYWHSFETDYDGLTFQNHYFPNLTLDPEWDDHFVYVRSFDDYAFSITHPLSPSIAPPDTEHRAADLVMLAAFEANFSTMNSEVMNQVPFVRFIPPAVPVADPSGNGFFRVWADWSVDSDGDNVPDWEEFAMMAGVAGVGEDGALLLTGTPNGEASPASPDTDGDGILDSDELDFDQDGIPRSEDADPLDGVIGWGKVRPTRYALFDIPLGYYENGYPDWPIGVNSQGKVLFRGGVYSGDSFQELPSPANMDFEQAYALNDEGVVLGAAQFDWDGQEVWGMAVWPPSPTGHLSDPSQVMSENMVASPTYDMASGNLDFATSFAKDGSFAAHTYEAVPGEDSVIFEYRNREIWKRGENGFFTRGQPTVSTYCKANDIHWGWNETGRQILASPIGSGDLGATDFSNFNTVGNLEPVLSGGTAPSLFFAKQSWKKSQRLSSLTDISDTGIAIVQKSPSSENIPEGLGFWMNSKFLHPQTVFPDLPQTYRDWPRVAVRGMADKGHVVLTMDSGHPLAPSSCAVGFPCSVEDHVSDAIRLAYRDSDTDTVPFTGMDDVSITADKPDPSADNKIWIMAPIGSEAAGNDVKPHIPVSADNSLTIRADNVDGEKNVTEIGQHISLKGTGVETSDKDLILKLGTNSALNAALGVKAMKRRTVRVKVTPVAGVYKKAYPVGTEETAPDPPDYLPEEDRLEKYLNKVFELQLNAEIDLTIKPLVTLDFSTMGEESFIPNNLAMPPTFRDKFLDTNHSMDTVEQLAFLPLRDPNADINVYVYGGLSIRHWYFHPLVNRFYYEFAVGLASTENREAWVDGDFFNLEEFGYEPGDGKYKHVMYTIAHEIGHIIIKEGHPDQGHGAAPLPGTDHLERLMVAGGGPNRGKKLGTRIVKGEWDAAEEWLKMCPYPPIQTSSPNQ